MKQDFSAIRKLGIVAGSGELPLLAAREARAQQIPLVIYSVAEENFSALPGAADFEPQTKAVTITRFGHFLQQLGQDQISHVVMLGKVKKEHLFRGLRFDSKTLWLLASMINHNDDTIFHTIERELKKIKVEILPQGLFLPHLFLPAGVYSRKKPDKQQWRDIRFGMYYARKMGELDIGQTVVVSNQSVLAVEAIEGTDAAIRRGGLLAGKKKAVVCKSEKKKQDPRFDVPTVGLETLASMAAGGCQVLAIEANRTLVVTPERLIEKANQLGLVLVASPVEELPV